MPNIVAAINAGDLGVILAALTFFVLVYTTTTKSVKERRREKAIVAGKERTALEEVRDEVRESRKDLRKEITAVHDDTKLLISAVFDRGPSLAEPQGHKGLQSVVAEHTDTLRKLLPNGGNTNDPGDLIYKIAKDRGLTDPPE